MRRLALLFVIVTAGCAQDSNPLPAACLESASAMRAAASSGSFADGTLISTCVRRADGDAELQDLGIVLVRAAERLADERRARDLGFLVGAVRRGAAHSKGVAAEVARRVEAAGRPLAAEPELARGLRDGRARG